MPMGPAGEKGETGPKGDKGEQGAAGPSGITPDINATIYNMDSQQISSAELTLVLITY